jgi:hypothetical protein
LCSLAAVEHRRREGGVGKHHPLRSDCALLWSCESAVAVGQIQQNGAALEHRRAVIALDGRQLAEWIHSQVFGRLMLARGCDARSEASATSVGARDEQRDSDCSSCNDTATA